MFNSFRENFRVSKKPGKSHTIADDMEPEDGCFWVYDTNDTTTRAFPSFGIDSLTELMSNYSPHGNGG